MIRTSHYNHPFKNKIVILLCLTIMVLLLSSCGSESNTYRVGLLSAVDSFPLIMDAFKDEMGKLGYEEGDKIVYDLQLAHGDADKMKEIAEKFVADEVDLIVTSSNGGALAAKDATAGTDIPVVFTLASNLVQVGIVSDLREPGGNVTGVRSHTDAYLSKDLELLIQMAPEVKRVWTPYNPDYPTIPKALATLRETAPKLGVELVEVEVKTPDEVVAQLEAQADAASFDAILIMPDPLVHNPTSWGAMRDFANKHKLPIAAISVGHTQDGALLSYAPNDAEFGQRAALQADKILRGADPASMPVITADPQLVINYNIAQALGLTIKESLLVQAVEVIK